MTAIELEKLGCRTFVCPNLRLIDEKGKELNLSEETIKKAKNIAIEYFKKTYHRPPYSSAKHLLPSFIYVASTIDGSKVSQIDIANVFGSSCCTIRKWYNDIMNTVDIKMPMKERKCKNSACPNPEIIKYIANEIDKKGKTLQLNEITIEKAKSLSVRYLESVSNYHRCPIAKQLVPAFIYTASVIENDKRTQMDIYMVSGVAESIISKWHNDILRVLGMNIISSNNRVIAVLER